MSLTLFYYYFSFSLIILLCLFFFFFNDTATTEIYTLSLHDALPISPPAAEPCLLSRTRWALRVRSPTTLYSWTRARSSRRPRPRIFLIRRAASGRGASSRTSSITELSRLPNDRVPQKQ